MPSIYRHWAVILPVGANKPPKIPNTKAVRTSKWKLIFNEYNNTKELYDLENDPDENENLIDKNLEIQKTVWKKFLEIQFNKSHDMMGDIK